MYIDLQEICRPNLPFAPELRSCTYLVTVMSRFDWKACYTSA